MNALDVHMLKGYELRERLGAGAFGEVYKARQVAVDREVAVKLIAPHFANQPDFIRRFEAEAQLVANLEHLHIVPLYDYWREPDCAFLVMRLMKGGSLEDRLKNGPLELEDGLRLVEQVASALGAAHERDVVHCDLKPANILLDEAGNAFLSDFGIARYARGGDSPEGISGTPGYLTPEQVRGDPVTPQTDIYSLGVVLFELLAGGHPFPDSPSNELLAKHLQEPLPPLRAQRPDLPPGIETVIQRATAKDPKRRYPDVQVLVTDLPRVAAGETLAEFAPTPARIPTAAINPYKGLRPFLEADAADFFGREALTGQLIARMLEPVETHRFLAVVGPSGSGKSSVVRAGLMPALRKGALPGSQDWFFVQMLPGKHPLAELAQGLDKVATRRVHGLQVTLGERRKSLQRALEMSLPPGGELLLVVDQFEEVFTLAQEVAEAGHFLELIHAAVSAPDSRLRVLVTLRADFYDRPLAHPDLGLLMEGRTQVVLPLTPQELEQAICGPAKRAGVSVEPELVSTILEEVQEEPGCLPMLQYTLTELFEEQEDHNLTGDAYRRIGGVMGSLATRAEGLFAVLDEHGQEAARQLFLRLVALGEETAEEGISPDTRRRALRSELEGLLPFPTSEGMGAIARVIDAFGRHRLLTFDRDPATRAPTVELAHEALLRAWPRLQNWLEDSRDDLRTYRKLSTAASDWVQSSKEGSFLLRGTRLAQFLDWEKTTSLALTQEERDFLTLSQEAEAARKERQAALERRSRNFLRALVAVFAVATVVAIVLSIFAFNQQGIAQENEAIANRNASTATVAEGQALFEAATAQAEAIARGTAQAQEAEQRQIAQEEAVARATAQAQEAEQRQIAEERRHAALIQASIGLASQSILELDGSSPDRALPLALEALENYPYTWQAERALSLAVLNSRLRLQIPAEEVFLTGEISRDGSRILTADSIGTVKIWDAATWDELAVMSEGNPTAATWSPDETAILSTMIGGTSIQVWNSPSGSLRFNQDVPSEIRFRLTNWAPWASGGDRFVTAHEDGIGRVWDAETGALLLSLEGHEGELRDAVWSPAGNLILTTSVDNTARLWDADTGEVKFVLPGTDWGVVYGSWSPTGDRVALRGLGAHVYDTATGEKPLTLVKPDVWFNKVLWSPDGGQILTTGLDDGTAHLWDAETGEQTASLPGLTQALGAAWSSSGELVAIEAGDGTIRVLDAATGLEILKLGIKFSREEDLSIFWSPNEDLLYASGSAVGLDVFDLTSAQHTIDGLPGVASFAAWSPSGDQIARGYGDGIVKVWNATTGEEIFSLPTSRSDADTAGFADNYPLEIAWSPTGDQILTTNVNGTVKVWDAVSGEMFLEFTGHHGGEVFEGDWSLDGRLIATAGFGDGRLLIWDSTTGKIIRLFEAHEDMVAGVAWSPEGDRIASTGGMSGNAFIWDPETGEILLDLYPPDFQFWVNGVAWSKDGSRIAIHSDDNFGRIFDTRTGEELVQFCCHTTSTWEVSWSLSGERLLTASGDGTVKVWDAASGVELIVYDVGGFPGAKYSPDGTQVVIITTDGTTRVYPTWQSSEELIAYAREHCLIRELTPDERRQFGLPEK